MKTRPSSFGSRTVVVACLRLMPGGAVFHVKIVSSHSPTASEMSYATAPMPFPFEPMRAS